MLAVNVVVALVVALVFWYAASRGLAQVIFATESRNPRIARRSVWGAVEVASTFGIFLAAVAVWLGLTYLLEHLSR
jgi:hypothetical protein